MAQLYANVYIIFRISLAKCCFLNYLINSGVLISFSWWVLGVWSSNAILQMADNLQNGNTAFSCLDRAGTEEKAKSSLRNFLSEAG